MIANNSVFLILPVIFYVCAFVFLIFIITVLHRNTQGCPVYIFHFMKSIKCKYKNDFLCQIETVFLVIANLDLIP